MKTPSGWEFFSLEELTCHCGCGRMEMKDEFMRKLVALRDDLGVPLRVTSGFRCSAWNRNVSTTGESGPHTTGRAVDIAIAGVEVYDLVRHALAREMMGIGLRQHGPWASRFIHLDDLHIPGGRPRIWTYP